MQRLLYLDALKGILIVLVILGHALQFNIDDYQHVFLFRFIYSFHMPLFFLISGYLTFKRRYDGVLIQKRAMQLLIPFVAWACLLPFLENGVFNFKRSCNALLYPDNGLWFLYNLFVYCVVFNLSERFARRGLRQEILFIFSIVLLYLAMIVFRGQFNCSQLCWFLPFFAMGYYWHKYEFEISGMLTVLLGGVYLAMMPFWMMRETPLFYQWIDFGSAFSYGYRYVVQILGAAFFFILGKRLLTIHIPVLQELGTMTLGIYAFQFVVLHHLGQLLKIENKTTIIIIETIAGVAICYIVVRIVQRIKYVRLLLIGEK